MKTEEKTIESGRAIRVLKGLNLGYTISNNRVTLNEPKTIFSEEELTDKFRSIPRKSLMDRFWFWLGPNAIYHFGNGNEHGENEEQLAFQKVGKKYEPKYRPVIENPTKDCKNIHYVEPKPFCSDQQ